MSHGGRVSRSCRPGLDWLVELVYQDLLDWSNWFMRARTLPTGKAGMVAIGPGSNKVAGYRDYAPDALAGARMETGMDNSPMFDCGGGRDEPTCGSLFDAATGQMQLIDVGMTSQVISEAEHIALLADILGKTEDGAMLRKRAASLRASLADNWDNETGIFVNRRPSGGAFYHRISPTSFYALMAGAATDAQAARMVEEWLLNPKHFAITAAGDHAGNADGNWWGLPSIAGSDPAFPKLGYWRKNLDTLVTLNPLALTLTPLRRFLDVFKRALSAFRPRFGALTRASVRLPSAPSQGATFGARWCSWSGGLSRSTTTSRLSGRPDRGCASR